MVCEILSIHSWHASCIHHKEYMIIHHVVFKTTSCGIGYRGWHSGLDRWGYGSKKNPVLLTVMRGGRGISIHPSSGKIFFHTLLPISRHVIIQLIKGDNYMLKEMLQRSESFQKLPIPEQHIYSTLAEKFEESTMFLFLDPQELHDFTGLGSRDLWTKLLNMQETNNYIKGQMGAVAQISQRKTFKSLVEQAIEGNVSAAKQVQELSGILNSVDTNKIIIMHRIPRANEEVK